MQTHNPFSGYRRRTEPPVQASMDTYTVLCRVKVHSKNQFGPPPHACDRSKAWIIWLACEATRSAAKLQATNYHAPNNRHNQHLRDCSPIYLQYNQHHYQSTRADQRILRADPPLARARNQTHRWPAGSIDWHDNATKRPVHSVNLRRPTNHGA